jgi:NAD-dependent SIR2 family protein deacetylase
MSQDPVDAACERAAEIVANADALIIAAGAGLGVDSGLPDFRGREGFWRAYPALGRARLDFTDIANPEAFRTRPALAWGFYGHRLDLYRRTVPHAGFDILRALGVSLPHGAFVFTSNVDGQFQKAGFPDDQVVEAHGSIHRLQCLQPCSVKTWPATRFVPEVDVEQCQLLNQAPRCPFCGALARPNILMFGDWAWVSDEAERKQRQFEAWRRGATRPVVLELGAGTAVLTVRQFSQSLRGPLIRINPDAPVTNARSGVSIPLGARDALFRIATSLSARRPDFARRLAEGCP